MEVRTKATNTDNIKHTPRTRALSSGHHRLADLSDVEHGRSLDIVPVLLRERVDTKYLKQNFSFLLFQITDKCICKYFKYRTSKSELFHLYYFDPILIKLYSIQLVINEQRAQFICRYRYQLQTIQQKFYTVDEDKVLKYITVLLN